MSKRETPSRGVNRPGRKPKRRISDASESLGKPEAKRIQRDASETEELRSKIALQKLARPMPTDDFVSDMDRRKRVREILLHILSKLKFKVSSTGLFSRQLTVQGSDKPDASETVLSSVSKLPFRVPLRHDKCRR